MDAEKKACYVMEHRARLIQDVSAVMPIVDSLGTRVYPELYTEILGEKTRQQQMRILYVQLLQPGTSTIRAEFYNAVKEHQPFLLEKNVGASSPVAVASSPVAAASSPTIVSANRHFAKYMCELTLDPNTANSKLSLSENNKKVDIVTKAEIYPPDANRFMSSPQVMCKEPLTGRCYSEVQCSGSGDEIEAAVTYRSINKQGNNSWFGYNKVSWSLVCNGGYQCYKVRHNEKETVLPVSRSSYSNRVGVYVDHAAGTVSFYAVSSDTLTLLHTFKSTFTEPLYVGFHVGYKGSVSL